jgi:NADH:ubiquinone oxidoreductase subunit 5 (subunit L)/multisubunit Na+/H+ antiporter MnhA subunit
MLSIINLVFLFLFGVEPLAKYFSKKILFRQAQRRQPSVYMLSIINLVFLFLFGVEPLAKYFSKKILFRQAQRCASAAREPSPQQALVRICVDS